MTMTDPAMAATPRAANDSLPERLPINAVPVRHWKQWIAAAILIVLLAATLLSLATNDNIHYPTIGEYLFNPSILKGLGVTFQLAIIAMLAGIVIGILVAVARMSTNRVLNAVAEGYIWLFRGVPLLVQLLLFGNFALLAPELGIAIPFTDTVLLGVDTNKVITPFMAAILALSLHEGAYMAEVVRGGILAVDKGQSEAATAVGMTRGLAMRRIVLPQALRVIIPPTGNQFITLLKATALVAVIAGHDLMSTAQNISAQNYRTIELLLVASVWYLAIVSILSFLQRMLERRLSRGVER